MDQIIRPTTILDTRGAPARDAIDMWQEIAGGSFHIGIDRDDRNRFALSMRAMRVGAVLATSTATTAQTLDRNTTCVRHDGIDQFGFFLQLNGSRAVRAGGRQAILRPGAVQFFDMAQEDCSIAAEGESLSHIHPRQASRAP